MLVDQPSLIHDKNKLQGEADVKVIWGLVEKHTLNERTDILAVVSAKIDYAN